jgi:hypothetical protein
MFFLTETECHQEHKQPQQKNITTAQDYDTWLSQQGPASQCLKCQQKIKIVVRALLHGMAGTEENLKQFSSMMWFTNPIVFL